MTPLNDLLDQQLEKFIENLNGSEKSKRDYFHYRSVINIARAIKFYSNEKAQGLKKGLVEYLFEVEEMDYTPAEKIQSALMYKEYIFPVGSFLIYRKGFITRAGFKFFILYGIIIDGILAYLVKGYYYPIFIVIFLVWGYYKQKTAEKENKLFSINW